ncbi:MAG: hypothetical protein OXT67_09490, partial [Zetaproteobacteria bacterium]|nr:hypothetical protein [Zetaproteobacteria bacterium]
SKIFHNDLGMMGATARYHRARSGAMDRGGFELEMIEHAGNYVNKYLAAYKTKFNMAIDADLDVELAWRTAGAEFVGTGVGILSDHAFRGARTGKHGENDSALRAFLNEHGVKKGGNNALHLAIGSTANLIAAQPGRQGMDEAADSSDSMVDDFIHPYHRQMAEDHIRANRADQGEGFSPWFPVNLEQRKKK